MVNRAMSPRRQTALVLLGPTGSGKSPLGDVLAARGLWGRRAVHFDFGAHLRAAAGGAWAFADADRAMIRRMLAEGALLEDRDIRIAETILDGFLAENRVGFEDWLIMNGLPRHAGQARLLASRIDVRAVVALCCRADVAHERIRGDSGGDRKGRADDAPADIARKLRVYDERTQPLITHYRELGARVKGVPVGVRTQPATLAAVLEAMA